jgi:hypothetical protein
MKERNLAMILNRNVSIMGDDPQILVVAGGVDVTDQVIAAVNRK